MTINIRQTRLAYNAAGNYLADNHDWHGRRKRGYAGDLTPPTIYVEGILIYPP